MTTSPPTSRRRGPLLGAALVFSAVAASAAASAALSEEAPVPAEEQMQAEIDAMVDAGVSPDDPKVDMLEQELEELEEGGDANPPPEPGVDVEALLDQAEAEEATEDAGIATRSAGPDAAPGDGASGDAAPAWESGEIMCEVVPGQLGPDDIAGARCISVPQPDGTSRYVALGADGTVRTVAFGHDGAVRRLPDAAAGTGVDARTVTAPTPEGDLAITPPGRRPVTVDLP